MDYKEFVSKPKSMLIAPAGYGKTHTIAECLSHTTGKQLILTHTHAGIASIKEKIAKANIPNNKFHIETITGYAQKYVYAFYTGQDIPDQRDSALFYPFIILKATGLLNLKPIADVVYSTYAGVFIDEYQDCTVSQHNFIGALSHILPTRILGDHLQGIFKFNEDLVDLTKDECMGDFLNHKYELLEPRRWEHSNPDLGNSLKLIRANIESSTDISLNDHASIEVIIANERDIYDGSKEYNKRIWKLQRESSLLIIHPESASINPRKKLISAFSNSFLLVEAIDDKDFYLMSEALDSCTIDNVEKLIRDISYELFNATILNNWFNENGLKRKTSLTDIAIIAPIKLNIEDYRTNPSFLILSKIFKQIKNLNNIKCYRKELFSNILKSLDDASYNDITVYEAMVNKRNQTRRIGRKIDGRCIGTTLLTKGLEFDTVVVLDAHKFKCPKNLYVALTRARKKLIVFSNNQTLSPY